MGRFVKGDIVVLPFPFSDLSSAKRRPALVVSALEGDDVILCQITSRSQADHYSIQLGESDFLSGALKQLSNIRPNRLFTADSAIVLYTAGRVSESKIQEVVNVIIRIVSS